MVRNREFDHRSLEQPVVRQRVRRDVHDWSYLRVEWRDGQLNHRQRVDTRVMVEVRCWFLLVDVQQVHLVVRLAVHRQNHRHQIRMIDSVGVLMVVDGQLVFGDVRHHEVVGNHRVDLIVHLHHCHRALVLDQQRVVGDQLILG